MRYRTFSLLIFVYLLLGGACASQPPAAKVLPTKQNLSGLAVVDDYWWLRNKSDPAVINYLKAENAYTDAMMKPLAGLEDALYKEMNDRLPDVNESVPARDGEWWYSVRHDDEYPTYVRRHSSASAAPLVIADVNELAKGHAFFDYIQGPVSDNGNLLAFATDVTGNRQYVLQVKDLADGKTLADHIELADSYAWASDNRTLYYVKEDDSKRAYRLYRHTLGSTAASDVPLYEEKDDQFSIQVGRTRDKKFIVLSSESSTTSETRVIPSDKITEPMLIEPRKADREYYVDHRNGRFYIRVNDTSENFRIVTTPDDAPGRANWSELAAARRDVIIADFDLFAHDLVVSERGRGLPQLALAKLPDGRGDPADHGALTPEPLHFDEPDYAVAMDENYEFDPPAIRITYTSLTTPTRTIALRLSDESQTMLKQYPVVGPFDPANYKEERLFATALDGTSIPISLVYRISSQPADSSPARPAGPRPLLLEGYGAYGMPEDVSFSSERLSLLNRGVIYAIAHVRGGGEYGRDWYNGGRLAKKPNTFSDFIACAEYLVKKGYTAPDKLAITGASAGGLLIGAVLNESPTLFHAAIADVPWVDVLADMSDPTIPLTTLEYTEWGDPHNPAQRSLIASYDPYTNVRPQAYPAMLVRESLNDSQVQYWDAARWVAKLRAAKKQAGEAGKSELLLKFDLNAGHGGASGQYAEIRDEAFDDAWLLQQWGLTRQAPLK